MHAARPDAWQTGAHPGASNEPVRPRASRWEVRTQVSKDPMFASAKEALGMLESAMGYLSAADATAMAAEVQAQCLMALERANAMGTAARASVLGAFTAARGYCEDADYSPKSWLIHKTRVTKGTAVAHAAWARRAAAHPRVAAVLAAGQVSESVARAICTWTDTLPEDCREAADGILVGAALAGLALGDLAALFAEIRDRSRPEPDKDRDRAFEDRSVRLETTFDGAGVLTGDLTPQCAAVVRAVLDALSAPAGAEDTRSHAQRYHDALAEAMRRLVAAGLLPERAGQPVKVWAHVSLADLMMLEGSSALLEEWAARVRAGWAAHRAAASVTGSDGAAWLDGDAARAAACDAPVTPVVTGEVHYAALDGLVRLCVELARIQQAEAAGGLATGEDSGLAAPGQPGTSGPADPPDSAAGPAGPGGLTVREALEQAIIGQAVQLLSGPGGLASFLRRRQLGARLGGPSLPLDVGVSRGIPAAIRAAVILRDQHCRFPGGCDQPAAACEVHHLTHKANGGKTSVTDCALFCTFHHQVMIHQMGWMVVLNPDGTTTAWNPDKTKILHSHSPPARPG